MAVHYLKTWPQYFAAIISGEKTFEIRKNDREFKVGDSLCLQEFIPSHEQFTGRVWVVIVTYIFNGGSLGVYSSYCVLGIRQLSTAELGIKLNVTQQRLNATPSAPAQGTCETHVT